MKLAEASRRIQIVTVLGSMRAGNMTGKALALVNDELGRTDGIAVTSIDPAQVPLVPPGADQDPAVRDRLQEAVAAATGIVLATPEYHGSFSSVMKLVIENLGFPSKLRGKPVALLGVAAGTLGAVKSLEHLRSVCSHVGAIVLPGPVSVASVNDFFDEHGNCLDAKMEERIRGVGCSLINYIERAICPGIALEEIARKRN